MSALGGVETQVLIESSEAGVELLRGQILCGKYKLEALLGKGGMGAVLCAEHTILGERVALKLITGPYASHADSRARFEQEARAAARIHSEHVVRVMDVDQLPTGTPFLVMEYLQGINLDDLLANHGALPLEQAVDYLMEALVGVAEAHVLGVVHRDLKPANLFLSQRPSGLSVVKILDFGISKVIGSQALSITQSMTTMGSPRYMSPEQFMSAKNVDMRTDIWALGVILYALLTQRTPFDSAAESFLEIADQVRHNPTPSVRLLRADLPLRIEQIIGRCLEKDRDRRYANVALLALDLVEFGSRRARSDADKVVQVIQGAGLSASSPSLPVSAPVGVRGQTVSAWGKSRGPSPSPRTRAVLWVLVGALATAAVGSVAVWQLNGKTQVPTPAPSGTVGLAGTLPTPEPVRSTNPLNPLNQPAQPPAETKPEIPPVAASTTAAISAQTSPKPAPPVRPIVRPLPPAETLPGSHLDSPQMPTRETPQPKPIEDPFADPN